MLLSSRPVLVEAGVLPGAEASWAIYGPAGQRSVSTQASEQVTEQRTRPERRS